MFSADVEKVIRQVATANKINPAALLAVVETESAGQPFWNVGGEQLPPIRWEGHYFYARLEGEQLKTAVALKLASKKVGGIPNPKSYAARYTLLANAKRVNESAALESVSWGMGQVMGANWKSLGYPNVQALVKAAQTVEGQVDMMVRFLQVNDLIGAMNRQDWTTVARIYNGSAYKKNAYDTKMADAFRRYSTGAKVDLTATMQMQKMLNAVGSYNIAVDGLHGDETTVSLRDFQLKSGLLSDGLYGPITKEALEKAYVAKTNGQEVGVGGTTTAVGAAGSAIMEVAKQIQPLAGGSLIMQGLFALVMVVGVFLMIKPFIWKK